MLGSEGFDRERPAIYNGKKVSIEEYRDMPLTEDEDARNKVTIIATRNICTVDSLLSNRRGIKGYALGGSRLYTQSHGPVQNTKRLNYIRRTTDAYSHKHVTHPLATAPGHG